MNLTYFKRYRMEIDLLDTNPIIAEPLPPGFQLLPWHPELLELHAEAKYHSFRAEIDANVFPCLGESSGCLRLMSEISRKEGFLSGATWLLVRDPRTATGANLTGAWQSPTAIPQPRDLANWEMCGTIQGIRDRSGMGAIQNLGIVPSHRGMGFGSVLMKQALEGFRQAGLTRAFLEVTAQNQGAIRLYRRLGFISTRTVYKAVEVAYS